MHIEIQASLFDYVLTDKTDDQCLAIQDIEKLFAFFKTHPLFNWTESNNGCEARADAICRLLLLWKIPHYKAWVFGGNFLKGHVGGLKQHWNYHVAPVIQAKHHGQSFLFVIDPSTSSTLQNLQDWAATITDFPHSYHFIKDPNWYIFNEKHINANNWYARDKQNYKWMIQGIAGINGLSSAGKAKLCFLKKRIAQYHKAFNQLKHQYPL
jgi:hypothetical protein